jgi:flagellin
MEGYGARRVREDLMRINPIGSAGSLREIQRNLLEISRLQEHVSSGSKINKASDGAASLAISEKLRAQLAGLSQAEENISRSMNVLNTAEGGLSQIGDLLTRGQALSLEAAGALSSEERQAVQGELDSLVAGIRRIGASTGFAGQNLLDGTQGFTVENANAAFGVIEISQMGPGSLPASVNVNVTAAATQGQAGGAIATQAGDVQVEIRGALGAVQLSFAAGATRQEVADAINAQSGDTGVEANATTGVIRANELGSAAFAEVRNLSGTLTGVTEGRVAGTDVQAAVNGQVAAAQGNTLTVGGGDLDARISLDAGTGPGTYGFQVTGGGFRVQAGDNAALLGIRSVLPSGLGRSVSPAGLESVVSGGANSLASNPGGAASVFGAALSDLGRIRGQLGAAQSDFLMPLSNSLQVAFENLSATESEIRDTDFAKTLSELASRRIRTQAGVSVLAQSQRLSGEGVLRLLG